MPRTLTDAEALDQLLGIVLLWCKQEIEAEDLPAPLAELLEQTGRTLIRDE